MKFPKYSFQILSDIHLEKKKFNKSFHRHPITASHLILAGDIGNPYHPNYAEYLYFCSNNYSHTFLISGNHEYWGSSIHETDMRISYISSKFKNIHYLNNSSFLLPHPTTNINIFGATLWSHINYTHDLTVNSSDNVMIKNFSYKIRNSLFTTHASSIMNNKFDIIITHHSPTFLLNNPAYHESRKLFCSHLDKYIPLTKFWICGHLHNPNYNHPYKNLLINPYSNNLSNCNNLNFTLD